MTALLARAQFSFFIILASTLALSACGEKFIVDGGGSGLGGSGASASSGGSGTGATTGSGSSSAGGGTASGGATGSGGRVDAPVNCTIEVPGCVIDWAGDAASPLPFSGLAGITGDGTNIYVTHINQVSSINVVTGVVTPIAGSGSEGDTEGVGAAGLFTAPTGIVEYSGSLFVTSLGNSGGLPKIKRVNIATKKVTNYVALNSAILKEPRGLAVATVAGVPSLLIADAGNHTIVRVAIADVAPTPAVIAGTHTVAGDGTKNLHSPYAIAVMGSKAYIADTGNNKIRMIDLTVVPTAGNPIPIADVWGNGTPGYAVGTGPEAILNGPTSVAVAGANLILGDSGNLILRGGKPGEELVTIAGVSGNKKHQVGGGKNAGFDSTRLQVYFDAGTSHTFITETQVVRRMSPP